MDKKVRLKASSIKMYSNVSSIPKDDLKELTDKLDGYQSSINTKFDKVRNMLNNREDVSWEAITDYLSTHLENIGEEMKVWEPNESNDRGW
jgi:hypothetical protein